MTGLAAVVPVLLAGLIITCASASDPLAGMYGTYYSDTTSLAECVNQDEGVCASMCCVQSATFASDGYTLELIFDPATFSRCGATSATYSTTQQIQLIEPLGNGQTLVKTVSSTTILDGRSVAAVFTTGVKPKTFDVTISSCTIEEVMSDGASHAPPLFIAGLIALIVSCV
jgi:hypothetical protein